MVKMPGKTLNNIMHGYKWIAFPDFQLVNSDSISLRILQWQIIFMDIIMPYKVLGPQVLDRL